MLRLRRESIEPCRLAFACAFYAEPFSIKALPFKIFFYRFGPLPEAAGNLLQVDTYSLNAILWAWEPKQQRQCHLRGAVAFHVMENAEHGARGAFLGNMPGVVRPLLEWEMESDDLNQATG